MQVQGKILTVDDDPNNITIVEELLDDNYDLKTATSGEEALEIAQEFRPDIIILDIMMPGMNGYEACRKLREYFTSEHTKIIMVSARAMLSERLEGYKAGADDYITKPFDGDEFLAKIRLYMSSKPTKETEQMNCKIPLTVIDNLKVSVVTVKNIISDTSADISATISKQMRHQLEIANDCIDIIESTMNNIHDISEIQGSNVELRQSIFSMQSVVSEVIEMLEPKVSLRKACMSTDMPSEELLINADRGKIVKILENLIGSAIRDTHEGNSINIRVKSIENKIEVYIEVNRAGTECSKEDEYLNQFDQCEKNLAPVRQDGDLALVVAKRLAELHGGRICVQYKSKGSIAFSFEIPISIEAGTTLEPVLSGAGFNSGT